MVPIRDVERKLFKWISSFEGFSNGFPHLKGISYTLDFSLFLRSKLSLVRHTRNDFSRSAENHSWNRVTKSIMERRVLCKLNPIRKTLVPKHYIKIIKLFSSKSFVKVVLLHVSFFNLHIYYNKNFLKVQINRFKTADNRIELLS